MSTGAKTHIQTPPVDSTDPGLQHELSHDHVADFHRHLDDRSRTGARRTASVVWGVWFFFDSLSEEWAMPSRAMSPSSIKKESKL